MGLVVNKISEVYFEIEIDIDINELFYIELFIVDEEGNKFYPIGKNTIVKKRKKGDRIKVRVFCFSSVFRVYLKLFSEGKLQFIQKEMIKTSINSKERRCELISNPFAVKEVIGNYSVTNSTRLYPMRNLLYNWRRENKEEVSIFSTKGNLIFLHSIMKHVWIECDGNQTAYDIAKKTDIKIEKFMSLLEELVKRELIMVIES